VELDVNILARLWPTFPKIDRSIPHSVLSGFEGWRFRGEERMGFREEGPEGQKTASQRYEDHRSIGIGPVACSMEDTGHNSRQSPEKGKQSE